MQEAVLNTRKERTALLKGQCGNQVMLGAAVTTGGTDECACSLGAPGCIRLVSKHTYSTLLGERYLCFLMPLCHTAVGYWFYKSKSTQNLFRRSSF